MENTNNNQDEKKENPYTPVNPFTNQPMPANPPNPAFNPPGEAKPPLDKLQPEPPASKPAAKFDFKIVFLYILLVAVGGIAAKYSLDFFAPKKPPKPVTPQLINVNAKPASQPLIKFVPGKKATSNTQDKKGDQSKFSLKKKIDQTVNPYTLSGIFFSGDQNYCIINDRVLGEGDSVEGAIVTRISTEDVELQLNDKIIKLNLRGR